MAEPLLRRRHLLGLAATGGAALLAGCRREGPRLLASRGEMPALWARSLPTPWSLRNLEDSAAVLSALGGAERFRAALVQLGDGWATTLPRTALQPIGTPALQARLAPMAAAVSRLFAPAGSPALAFPWSYSPWVVVLRSRPDLARRQEEGWNLLLDPSLAGKLVLPASPRVTLQLAGEDPTRLARLRRQAVAHDDRDGLNLLQAGEAEAAVLPRERVIPLLRRDPRLQAFLPASGAPLAWNLLLRPAGSHPEPPLEWLAEALEPPLLPRLLIAGWVPPVPRAVLASALRGFPTALEKLLLPPEAVLERCVNLPPLVGNERRRLQALWDGAAPPTAL